MPDPETDAAPGHDGAAPAALRVVVQRSGGLAGMVRTWRAEPMADERPRWWTLVQRCPWPHSPGGAVGGGIGADRFQWHLVVEAGDDHRAADLADGDLEGPWRALVDAVRAWPATQPER